MIALWKEWHLDRYLQKAWESGIVLAGVSAGANCWFDECVTDSIPGDLTPLPCLGFLKGSCCPHYDGEQNRRSAFENLIKGSKISDGIGIDDGAALHYIDDKLEKVVRFSNKGSAYKVQKRKDAIKEERMDAVFLEESLKHVL